MLLLDDNIASLDFKASTLLLEVEEVSISFMAHTKMTSVKLYVKMQTKDMSLDHSTF